MNKASFQSTVFYSAVFLTLLSSSCEKYLNEPSDKSLAVMTSLDDLQALLDNINLMNNGSPTSSEISSDNFYLTDDVWESLPVEQEQRMYIWAADNIFQSANLTNNDWSKIYRTVFLANTVLENLQNIALSPNDDVRWKDIKGQALVFRAVSFLDAVQIWSVAYDATTAHTDVGIPLRLQSDFNLASTRANVQQTYDQIIADLKDAIPLLPTSPLAKTRPAKAAAYGLLSRTYLWMREYQNACHYADSCLQMANELMDYNRLDSTDNFPIPRLNLEVVFDRSASIGYILTQSRASIPTILYDSYKDGDLRKGVFFRQESNGRIVFKGGYLGGSSLFTGPAVDEIYLTRAECFARNNQVAEAMQDMNTLLETRWRQGKFIPVTASSADDALSLVLEERQKQLLFRGLRWMDIKRLNKEGANISLTRTVKGETYTLPANSPRFALPLPDDLLIYFR